MRKLILAMFVPILLLVGVGVFSPLHTAAQTGGEVKAVSNVDLKRYSGKWFEIAKLPVKFQKQCVGNSTFTFNTAKDDGAMEVLSRCLLKDGKASEIRGETKSADATNAKMKISLQKFPGESLWIIDLDSNYQYAVIGNADRDYLYVLSRTPKLDDGTYQQILRRVEKMGYKPNRLTKTAQNIDTLKGTVIQKQ